ncbi:MAG: cation:proton antiporter [archaeon]
MAGDIFINLSIIIILAVFISGLMRILKQPLLIGYIITGIIAGPYLFNIIGVGNNVFETFSKLGVALLLFMVGLHLNPRVIKDVGKISLLTGLGQIFFTAVIGFFIAKAFGFTAITSIYIALALTFSSTIIIMKILTDIRQIDSLHGKIAIGFLIIQDLVAIFALMTISSLSNEIAISGLITQTILKGVLALIFVALVSYLFFPRLTKVISVSQEFLFLFSVGWCLALASLFHYLGFSIEIGALLAGVTLSISPYSREISSKTKPLRDFFIVLFFILLGSQMVLGDISSRGAEIFVFSLLILIGNPLVVMIIMGLMGYAKRTGFLAGLTVAQIGEFSLIFIALGVSVGHISQEVLSFMTFISLITIGGSTYLVLYSNKIYSLISSHLSIFERKKLNKKKGNIERYDSILFGYNRIGFGILNSLKMIKKRYLVVDFNPETIEDLSKLGISCVYGDAYDDEFISELPIENVKIIVSTIPEFEINLLLVEKIKRINPKTIVIARAHQIKDALALYEEGADYVLTPHFLGGEYISKMIKELKTDGEEYERERKKHIKNLKEILGKGHEHPDVNRN